MIQEFIKQGHLVFDIGANVGKWSTQALALGASVVAVEPVPQCVDILEGLGITVVPAACGEVDGETTIYFGEWTPVASADREWTSRHGGVVGEVTVNQVTLDTLINTYGKPNFIKIDTEGYEPEVLMGLSYAPKYLSFEYHGPRYGVQTRPDSSIRAAQLVNELGNYKFRAVSGDHHDIIPEWSTPWVDYNGIETFINDNSFWGDIYARRAR